MPFPPSTYKHRVTQRANVATEVLSSTVKAFSIQAAIPFKIGQASTSAYSFFTNNLRPAERVVQAMQACICTAHVGVLIAMLFKDDECSCTQSDLCNTVIVADLIYQGLLVSSYGISEAIKEQRENAIHEPVSPEPGV